MVYKLVGTEEELDYVGLDYGLIGKRFIKIGEYANGYWKMFYQTCEYGFYHSYEFSIPPYLLEKI